MSTPALALLQPEKSPARPRPAAPPRASLIHFDAIIDYLLGHPGARNSEIAAAVRRGPVWVSMVMRSDAFLDHYKARRAVLNQALLDGVQSRLAETAAAATDILLKKARENPLAFTIEQATTLLDKATGRLGFGQPSQPAPMQVNFGPGAGASGPMFVASAEQIARARDRMRDVQADMSVVASDKPAPIAVARVESPAPMRDRPVETALPSTGRPFRDPTAKDIEVVTPSAPRVVDSSDPFGPSVQVGRDA